MSKVKNQAAPAMRSFFSNRFIQAILLSGLFLQLGIWVRNFAILLFVTEQTDKDPFAITLVSVAEFAPIFLFSFIGGAFADRWKPKRTMVLCDLLSALSVFAVLAALVYGGWQAIFFATLVSSILSQFSQPSGMKLFKLHVPEAQMQMGMSMYQTIMAVFMVLGPMLGTFVYFRLGIDTAIAIMGTSFLLSALVLAFLPADPKTGTVPSSDVMQEMKMGFRYVTSNKLFLYMGAFFLVAGLGMGLISPLGIYLVTENLGLTSEDLQWFTAVNGFGMVFGGAMAMGLSKKAGPQAMLLTGFVVSALSVAVLGSVHQTWPAIIAQFTAGLMGPLIHISCNTLILKNADEAFVGRVNGILNPLFMGAMVLDMSLVGVLKANLPLTSLYLIAAGLFTVGALIMLPMLRLRPANGIEKIPVAEALH